MKLEKIIKQFILTTLLLSISAAATSAQSNIEQSIKNARDQFSDIKNRSIELERMKNEADKRPVNEEPTLNFPKIKEDFEQIQKLNSDSLQITASKNPVNYTSVLRSVSEINHRAARLKSNLFSVDPERDREAKNKPLTDFGAADIKILLNDLDKAINNFAHSPLFQNIQLVNSDASLDAQSNLDTVIRISSSIKEKAKKLTKGAFKN